MSGKEAAAPKATFKLDALREIERDVQAIWEAEKTFEADAVASNAAGNMKEVEKFFGTFPYPYMNGRLHLGHTFSLTKIEFAAQFARVQGKHVLFPFAFHCTGMPIKACADKLQREMEDFGNPPQFPTPAEAEAAAALAAKDWEETKENDLTKFAGSKSKVAAKSGTSKYQWDILRGNGVAEDEIPKFADPNHWLYYFPPHCQADMKLMGVGVDWRRAFITTHVNPFYDSFIRWQFTLLKEKNKIKFGKRYSVYSPKDGQPCMDHDRSKGEGIGPQEYTLIKLELCKPFPDSMKSLEETHKVYLVAGTLRPETMYGQTNCWVLPGAKYGVFTTNVDGEAFVCSARSARNMAYQGLTREEGKVERLASVSGDDLIGRPLIAPLAKYDRVYTLPMTSISMKKGTGIVTSVPSDAPDDYINLEVLKRKPDYRKKFGLTDEMVMPFDIVPIIKCPTLGDVCAQTACMTYKIESAGQRDQLDKAKEDCYKEGFYRGIMQVGPMAGKPVSEAKTVIRDQMVADKQAVQYAEPNGEVISRSGDECVVALVDQWYLDYGEEVWQRQVIDHLKTMEFYSSETRDRFEQAVDWLHEWACSRTYGLGTRLPWAEEYLVDSLSDSTIYMAYYTIAHLLQGGEFDGSKLGPAGIKPEQLTRPVWDYIFLGKEYPADCGIAEDTLASLRSEFEYWYPVDLRVSGKDLIQNHLVFFMYNHLAIFGSEKSPRSIRANGHVLLNDSKMSKSEGNFMTMAEGIEKFSADGMRLALADAGDSLEDANFDTNNSNAALLRLYTFLEWAKETIAETGKEGSDVVERRERSQYTFVDRAFEAAIEARVVETEGNYVAMNYRAAVVSGCYALIDERDKYLVRCSSAGQKLNAELIRRYVAIQATVLAPFIPHLCEHLWRNILGNKTSVLFGTWPKIDAVDDIMLAKDKFVQDSVTEFRRKRDVFMKPKKGVSPSAPTKVTIILSDGYPPWMSRCLQILAQEHDGATRARDMKELLPLFKADDTVKTFMKKAVPFIAMKLKEFDSSKTIKVFADSPPFDEKAIVEECIDIFAKVFEVSPEAITVRLATSAEEDRCRPGQPMVNFE